MTPPKAVFCWSGGKDSAYCLHKVLTENLFDVRYLLTTVNDEYKRISMHGVREELLDLQAASINPCPFPAPRSPFPVSRSPFPVPRSPFPAPRSPFPIIKVCVKEGTNAEYEHLMEEALLKLKEEGITDVIFGDIFLEDLRKYRETNLAKVGMNARFPLWKLNTSELIRDFIRQQFKTIICCTNASQLGEEWLGREIDHEFLEQLPPGVDPCGENGEFHTYCYGGPLFTRQISITPGSKVFKPLEPVSDPGHGFWFLELTP